MNQALKHLPSDMHIVTADMGRCTLGLAYWPSMLLCTYRRPKAEFTIAETWFDTIMELGDPGMVVIEGYSYGSLWQAQRNAEVIGIVKYRLHLRRIPFIEIPPTEGKKALFGKGRASKQQMMEAARQLGFTVNSEHEADALGLLLAYNDRLGKADVKEQKLQEPESAADSGVLRL